jgi:hypothetical protein
MQSIDPIYPVTVAGQNLKLRFTTEDSPSKQGINMQFVMENEIIDPREKQDIANKISVALQKKYGEAGLAIAFNDRNPYKNVISFIIPLDAISKMLVNILKG